MALPRSALLSLWLRATVGGSVGPDDFADRVRGDDPHHLVVDWPDRPEPVPLDLLPGLVRRHGAPLLLVALPAAGDPAGLAGPASFNAQAVDGGSALLLAGPPGTPALGLVPRLDARTVVWDVAHAVSPPPVDPGEAGRTLRQTLVTATNDLVRLDVASWQPEIPDLLMNLRDREALDLPPGLAPAAVDTLERADLCREIVALALVDEGGAISVHEMEQRRGCLTDLDRAARRAVMAVCSDSLVPS